MPIRKNSQIVASDFTGMVWPSVIRSLASAGDWLLCDGSAVSRSVQAALYAILCPSSTVTITIASPGVITWTAHPLANGDIVVFTNSGGALPTGIVSGTQYFVIGVTTNTFQIAATRSGTAINTSGSQSGTHTAQCFTFGIGDGSTTFNIPDLRGRMIIGTGTGSKAVTLPAIAIASNQLTVSPSSDLQQGMPVLYTGSGVTGLTTSTTYYVSIVDSTHIKLCSSQTNANAGTTLSISGTPSSGLLTYTLSARVMGDTGGEETHGIAITELAAHTHDINRNNTNSGSALNATRSVQNNQDLTASTGGDVQHNNMSPFASLYYYIHV